MYYRRQTVTSSDGSLDPVNLNGSLQVLYRQYHSNNRIVKDARKEIDASNAEDTTVYESQATMNQFDTEAKSLTDMGCKWADNLTWTTTAEGEIASVSDVDWVTMDNKSDFFA